jgi:hypothetical protein
MVIKRNLGRLGGLVAAFSLLFLPLASCGEAELTGINVFQAEGSSGHKAILVIALLSAVLAIFLVQHTTQIVLGLIGFATILVEYLFTIDDPERTIQLREGAFIAALGFLLVFLAGLLRTGRWATSPPPPPKKK